MRGGYVEEKACHRNPMAGLVLLMAISGCFNKSKNVGTIRSIKKNVAQ